MSHCDIDDDNNRRQLNGTEPHWPLSLFGGAPPMQLPGIRTRALVVIESTAVVPGHSFQKKGSRTQPQNSLTQRPFPRNQWKPCF